MPTRLAASVPLLFFVLAACGGQGAASSVAVDNDDNATQASSARAAIAPGTRTDRQAAAWHRFFDGALATGRVPGEQMYCSQDDGLDCLLRP